MKWVGELILTSEGRPPEGWVPTPHRAASEAPPGVWTVDLEAPRVPHALSMGAAVCRAVTEWSSRFIVVDFSLGPERPDEGELTTAIPLHDLHVGDRHDLYGLGSSHLRTRALSVHVRVPSLNDESLARLALRGADVRSGSGWVGLHDTTSEPMAFQRMASLVQELTAALEDEATSFADFSLQIEDVEIDERTLLSEAGPSPFRTYARRTDRPCS